MTSQPKQMRIVILTDSAEVGGTERTLRNLVTALGPQFEVTVGGTSSDVVDEIAAGRPSARRVVLPRVSDKRSIGPMLRMLGGLARLRPAVFHINLTSPRSSRFFVAATVLMPGARVVLVEHLPTGANTPLHQKWTAIVERFVDAHVAVGDTLARSLERERGLPVGRIVSIPNGVPKVELAVPSPRVQGPVVGCHVRMVKQKGLDLLLHACAPLDCHVLIVGDGPERHAIEKLAVDLEMTDRVRITGWQADARSWLGAIDVYALPSRYEGLPLSLVEAMMAARAIVATDVGAVSDAIVGESTGLLVPPGDAEALRNAIRRLLDDEALRGELGTAARNRALALYSVETMAAAYERLYESVAA